MRMIRHLLIIFLTLTLTTGLTFSQASRTFPHMNLGRAYEYKRLWLRALASYRRAVEEKPDYNPALEGIARIRGYLN